MNTLEFFRRVLPQSGLYVAATIESGRVRQYFYQTIEEIAESVIALDEAGNNTYFAVNAFITDKSRKQENVRASNALYVDIDCGSDKPYKTQRDGLVALKKFLTDAKLPTPLVISSGRGLHCYWTFGGEITPEEWQLLADALKRKTVTLGFEVDPVATADSARVLRPVGTFNPKNGAVVEMLARGEQTTADTLRLLLVGNASPSPSHPPSGKYSLLNNLAVRQEFPPANADVIETKCAQIEWAVQHQADVSEPFWYAMLGIAAFTADPDTVAIRWSDKHPQFNANNTLYKMNQYRQKTTGPSTCAALEAQRPGGCKGCIFKDKVKSPAQVGLQYAEIDIPETAPIDPDTVVKIPKPFKRTLAGIKMTIDETDIDVCRFDVIPISYGYDESLGYEVVRYIWDRPHLGWRELLMRQAYLTDGHREFASIIADQGIVLYNKKQTEYFQLMLRSYMEELRQQQTMTNLYATMGWKENNTQFVLGDKLLRRSEYGVVTTTDIKLSSRTAKVTEDLYGTAGTAKDWADFTSVLDKLNLNGHKFAIGASFAAPLFNFMGLKGVTLSLYGPTGAGKTLAQYWQQSIYGHPGRLHFTAKFTQNALFSRLALHNNLPFTIDEATMLEQKELGDFLYWVSQGRDKARLTKSAEERDARTWGTVVTVSTNRSLVSSMHNVNLDTDAQMARLLEITIPANSLFTKTPQAGRQIHDFLMTHYGVVGERWINWLMERGEAQLRKDLTTATAEFNAKYNVSFTGQERYWEQLVVLSDWANEQAHKLGFIKFDWRTGTQNVLAQIGLSRTTISVNKSDAFDLIGDFLQDVAKEHVTIMHTIGQKPMMDHSHPPQGAIRARYDVYRQSVIDKFTSGTLMLDRAYFRSWLSKRGGDFRSFIEELALEGALASPKSGKLFMGKDTPIRLGQTYVVGVNLNHIRLRAILTNCDDLIDSLTYGQLSVVK